MFSDNVYIIKCSDDSYYTGFTNNLDRRINEHIHGINQSCYTFKRRSLEIQFQETFIDVLQAKY
ncbi:GIY-YIG nuclease family protein [Bizionia sediminis]|uniref:GIY-YIG nuclease family protein n=1 Tax=Bizionia sediminis TaxID=1737064 RepID=A0ABW5KP96_9FLAO